ncbi:MAG TPA: hypothetical protein VK432_06005 [Stellaceae bacterium]|nr:hypothetical protein [Stellaceae bacterium]
MSFTRLSRRQSVDAANMIAASGAREYPASRRISAVRVKPAIKVAVEIPVEVAVEIPIEIPVEAPIKPSLIEVPVIASIDAGGVVTGQRYPTVRARR